MTRISGSPSNTSNPLRFALGLLALSLLTVALWNLRGTGADEAGAHNGQASEKAPRVLEDTDLVAPGEDERKVRAATSTAQTDANDPNDPMEDPNDGWGLVAGTAAVNGLPLETGKLHWHGLASGEQGHAPIEAGRFEFDAPVGEVTITAWIVAHNGFTVSNHESNPVDDLTKVVSITVLDAKPNESAFDWLYKETRVEGDVRTIPSQTPVAGTALYIRGTQSPCTVHATSDAAGYFLATVPASPGLSVSCNFGRTTFATPVLDGWTELRIPDAHSIEVVVLDGRTGKPISDYDFFFRESAQRKHNPSDWKRLRVGGVPAAGGPPATAQSDGEILSLPTGKIDLFVYAPRLGLAPHEQLDLEVGPNGPRIEVTLQPGGTLAFTCEQPPPTGLVVPDYDPDPIMVVEEHLYQWGEPSVEKFGRRVQALGAFPLNLLFTRRLSFNLQGEAVVKGLASGTYRVLHWREGVNWRSEPLEVLAGVTTHVQLIPE